MARITKRGPSPGDGARRTPPPEATGAESRFLENVRASGKTVEVQLLSGQSHLGVIEDFDRDQIKLLRSGGPQLLIRKSEIRYLSES